MCVQSIRDRGGKTQQIDCPQLIKSTCSGFALGVVLYLEAQLREGGGGRGGGGGGAERGVLK